MASLTNVGRIDCAGEDAHRAILELRRQLTVHGKLPKTVVLVHAAKTLSPGTVTTIRLPLSTIAQRTLKIASLLPKKTVKPVLTIVQKRSGHTRHGRVTLHVTPV